MKSLLQKYSLLAALTLALPFALVGCNKSADSDTTAPASNPPADTNMAPAMDTNAPASTNAMAAPADSTMTSSATTDTNMAPMSTNTPSK
jgi:hypothetical protein